MLERDNFLCQVQRPRCTGSATTAHHKLPSSQYPESWDPDDLKAACGPCNHHGAQVKNENPVNRQTIAHLEAIIEEQEAELAELRAKVAGGEHDLFAEAPRRLKPRIY